MSEFDVIDDNETRRPHTHAILTPAADRLGFDLHLGYGESQLVKQSGTQLFGLMSKCLDIIEANPGEVDFTVSYTRPAEDIIKNYWPEILRGVHASITMPVGLDYAPDHWTTLDLNPAGRLSGINGPKHRFVRPLGAAPKWREAYSAVRCAQMERDLIQSRASDRRFEEWHRPAWRAKDFLPEVFVEPSPLPSPSGRATFEEKRDAVMVRHRAKRRHEAIGRLARGEAKPNVKAG